MKKLLIIALFMVVILFPTYSNATEYNYDLTEHPKELEDHPYYLIAECYRASDDKWYGRKVIYLDTQTKPNPGDISLLSATQGNETDGVYLNNNYTCSGDQYQAILDVPGGFVYNYRPSIGGFGSANYWYWKWSANFDTTDKKTNEIIPAIKTNYFRFTNIESTTYDKFPKYPYSVRYQMSGYDDNPDTHFTIYMDYKKDGVYEQYFMSDAVLLANTDSVEGLPVDDYIIEDQFFLFRTGQLRIRVVVNGGGYSNKLVYSVEPIFDVGNTPICEIQNINEGQVYNEPPSFALVKKNIDYSVEFWVNDKKIETLPEGDLVERRYFRTTDVKIGRNTMALKKVDGTVVDSTYFNLVEGFGKNPNEIINDAQEKENELLDKNGKPLRPDSMNPIDWIIYILNLVGYYASQLSTVFSTAFTTAINIINQVLRLLTPLFGILPREWTVVITVSLSLGMILMILRR